MSRHPSISFGRRLALVLSFGVLVPHLAANPDELRVLPATADGVAPGAMMGEYLKRRALAALDRRDAEYETIKTAEDLQTWQRHRREIFFDALGPFPERTPLHARTVGRREFADYRIEKVLFESRPGFVVTATLYLPATPGPHPAVVHPTGHSETAKARDLYQRASIYLARNGIACLCYDPVGQGERRQLLGDDGRALLSTTQEHTVLGLGCTLLGTSLAGTMIWDGMRAIDYLQSRPDIDGKRIGCVGISGGGTLTSYLGAADERVAVSAPGCYLTGFRALLGTIGPQDIEQNLFNQIGRGLDQADYVLMRAPRPTLIMAATRDFFDIGGTWRVFRESKRAYGRLGFPERVDLVEAPTEHSYPLEHCVAGTRWFGRWFFGRELPVAMEEVATLPESELSCTPEGQVLRLPGARSLVELNTAEAEALAPRRRNLWLDRAAGLREVRRITGIRPLAELPPPRVEDAGRLSRDGYLVRKLVLVPEPGIRLPALLFENPAGRTGPAVLYLHGGGKHLDAGPGGPIERRVRSGERVLAVDLRGLGETSRPPARPTRYSEILGADGKDWSLAYLLGTSLAAMRAEDALVAARYLASLPGGGGSAVQLVARGEALVPALHAAALESELFSKIELEGPLVTWATTVRTPLTPGQQNNAVFGALQAYDLPDLIASLAASELTVSTSAQ